jgi:hypothetical protein
VEVLSSLSHINPGQLKALQNASGFPLSSILGPPVCGKTQIIIYLVESVLPRHLNTNLLLFAPSNAAADETLFKLLE